MNSSDYFGFIYLFLINIVPITWLIVYSVKNVSKKKVEERFNKTHVTEESFQKYAKFYGEAIPSDKEFDHKLNNIYTLITKNHIMDIKQIAKNSLCSDTECVLKIRYLKNKRLLGDYYIDTTNLKLLPCSEEDQKLLDKYKPFIYGSHSQINEIASQIPNPKYLDMKVLKKEIHEEILNLYKKGLLNGIKIDDIDGKIIYYTIEKRKVLTDMETVHCPNCGALNDVDVSDKVRCSYCKTIIKGSKYTNSVNI